MNEELDLSYEYEQHSFNRKIYHWPVCSKCGLLMLKNPLSDWAVKMGCDFKWHPAWKSTVKQMTRKK